jgi:hypothetical protein
MTLDQYRTKLGWSRRKLAHEAGVDPDTVGKAIAGKPIYRAKAGLIANAVSKGLGQEVTVEDFDGLNLAD